MIKILLIIMRGRKERKKEKMLENHHLNHQRKIKLLWILFKKTLLLFSHKDDIEKLIQKYPNAEWFTKKSGLVDIAKTKSNWFYMLLKSNIDQDEDCILGHSVVTVAKKIKELIKKDKLTIADLKGFRLEVLKRQYKNYVELEYHVDQLKEIVLAEAQ
nr:hypothetical protein [Tanacetum cinerariifolium]